MSQQKRALIAALVVFAILLVLAIKTNKPLSLTREETTAAKEMAPASSDIEEAKKDAGERKESAEDKRGMIASPVTPDTASPEPTSAERPAAESATQADKPAEQSPPKPQPAPVEEVAPPEEPKPTRLPRLVEIGAEKCIPCRMMQPILAELREEYAGKLQVDFVDVWKHPEQADKYGIQTIPTQVIYDSSGKEVFRHIGFWPKDEILAKFKELGIDLDE